MPVKLVTPSRAGLIVTTAALVSLIQLAFLQPSRSEGTTFACDQLVLEAALAGPMAQDNPILVEWVQGQMMPPSRERYNLDYQMSGLPEEFNSNNTYSPAQEFILEAVERIFDNSFGPGFFFVEAGAYNGEFLSNTLVLEKVLGWRGLLVEPSKQSYNTLLAKNRKAWAINACLSTSPYPSQELFTEVESTGKKSYIANGPAVGPFESTPMQQNTGKASSRMAAYHNASDPDFRATARYKVQCLPFYTMIRALNVAHVHFFSLDVEGAEMGILNTIPWDKFSFTMLAIEHVSGSSDELVSFMAPKGYTLLNSQYPDYIFVNNASVKIKRPLSGKLNKRKRFLGRQRD